MSKRRLSHFALLLALLFFVSPANALRANEGSKKSDEASKSDKQAAKQKAQDEGSGKEHRDGQEWFNRGYALHSSDHYAEAIEAFKHSIALGYRKATAMYNIACGYSLLNDRENAVAWLERAFANGFDRVDLLREDADLDPLRADVRFRKILDSTAQANDRDRVWREKASRKPDRLEQASLEFTRLDGQASRDGNAWAKIGLQLLLLRDLDRSLIALNKAVEHLDYKGATAMYNLACANALKGDLKAGLDWLERSVNAGFDNNERIQNDPDIASLRGDPRFSRIEKSSRLLSLSQFYKDAGTLYSKQQWAPAVRLYESLVQSEPNNGRAWFNLGYALHYSREHTRAIEAFEYARQLGYRRPTTTYNIACAYSMLDQPELAFDWLERAVNEGYDPNGYLNGDRDLDNLRSDPRFKRFVSIARDGKKDEK